MRYLEGRRADGPPPPPVSNVGTKTLGIRRVNGASHLKNWERLDFLGLCSHERRNIPDEPGVHQCTKYRSAPSNLLVDQIHYHIRGQAWHTSNSQRWMRNTDQVSKPNAVSMMKEHTKSNQKYVSQDRGGSGSTTGRPNSDAFLKRSRSRHCLSIITRSI